jgi:prepilin-type N-terminal cleavage/methylation domain-containing protein
MNRRGMTLIEMLIAMTATLILMAAVTQVFAVFGSAVSASRSILNTDAKLRVVAWKLREDLAGVTAQTLPPRNPASGEGYFEVIEGPLLDSASTTGTIGPADCDDALLFTTRASNEPFLGRATTGKSLQSTEAEIAWFARRDDPSPNSPITTYSLYRRQLLVVGYVGSGSFAASNVSGTTSWTDFYSQYDLSVRSNGGRFFPNTLSDLTRRECRFLHNQTATFPFAFISPHGTGSFDGLTYSGVRKGEDVVLTNVLAFDVRVFDPGLPLVQSTSGNLAKVPNDSGYDSANAMANGGYVDLGHSPNTPVVATSGTITWPHFRGAGRVQSGLASGSSYVYDTGSLHYEANGIDEGGGGTDQGTDGIDNDGDGKIDEPPIDLNGDGDFTDSGEDVGEMETSPPYPYPLRGLEVRIRCLDPESRQVRQVTVRHTFVPH